MSSHPVDDDAVRYLAGEADAEATARLGATLRDDPAARARFAELARLHGHLAEIGRRITAGELEAARLLAPDEPPDHALPPPVRRPRRRWIPAFAALAACLVLGGAVLGLAVVGARTRSLMPTIEYALGGIAVQRDGAGIRAVAGLRLRAGDRIAVADGGALAIVLTGGRCTLSAGASAEVEAADEVHRRVVLERGTMIADLSGRFPVAVRTAAATFAVADAAAVIAVDDRVTALAVSRGAVEVTATDGSRARIGAGSRWTGFAAPPTASAPLALASKD